MLMIFLQIVFVRFYVNFNDFSAIVTFSSFLCNYIFYSFSRRQMSSPDKSHMPSIEHTGSLTSGDSQAECSVMDDQYPQHENYVLT